MLIKTCKKEPKILAKAGAREIPPASVAVSGVASVSVGAMSGLSIALPIVLGIAGAFFGPMFTGDGTPRLLPAVVGLASGVTIGVLLGREANTPIGA